MEIREGWLHHLGRHRSGGLQISVDESRILHKNPVDVFLNLHIFKVRANESAAS